MSEKQARPWMAPLTTERMADMLKANEHLAVFKNADSVLVGDLVVMVEEITQRRAGSDAPSVVDMEHAEKLDRALVLLAPLSRQGEDYIWRPANAAILAMKATVKYLQSRRSQMAQSNDHARSGSPSLSPSEPTP